LGTRCCDFNALGAALATQNQHSPLHSRCVLVWLCGRLTLQHTDGSQAERPPARGAWLEPVLPPLGAAPAAPPHWRRGCECRHCVTFIEV